LHLVGILFPHNNNLLLGENIYGQTAWQLAAACGNIQALVKLWECTKDQLTQRSLIASYYSNIFWEGPPGTWQQRRANQSITHTNGVG